MAPKIMQIHLKPLTTLIILELKETISKLQPNGKKSQFV